MPEPSVASEQHADVARLAVEAWGERDVSDYVSAGVREMTAGTATDWGLAGAAAPSDVRPIALGGGVPDAATQPREELLAAMQRVLAGEDDAPLVYGGPIGYEPLRAEIAAFFARGHAEPLTADHYLLTNGAAGAISSVCSALLDPGDVVISEMPTFAGSLRTIRGHQARIVGVGMDAEGIKLDAVEAALDQAAAEGKRVKLIYTQPTFHNPTGLTMSLERRLDLIRLACERGIFLLEDHAYSELYFDEPPPPTLSELSGCQGVFTVGTFSKVIATGLRVGWVQAQPNWIEALVPARFDMGNSPLLHRMLHEYMVNGSFREHVEEMRGIYRKKAQTLMEGLRDFGEPYFDLTPPGGGFFLWLRLLDGVDPIAVQRAGIGEALMFPHGRVFYPNGETGDDPEAVRLAYSWTPLSDLEEAAQRLGRAFDKVASG